MYAIGEIALVVIGILLALQINNWNEYRKDRSSERVVLQNFTASLESDFVDVNQKISVAQKVLEDQEVFMSNSFVDFGAKYTLQQADSMLNMLFLSSLSFFPNQGFYKQIVNNNQINLIQSSKLKMNILNLYEQIYARHNDLDATLEQLNVDGLLRFLSRNFSNIQNQPLVQPLHLTDFDQLERHYKDLTLHIREIYQFKKVTYGSMLDCREAISSLLHNIRDEGERH